MIKEKLSIETQLTTALLPHPAVDASLLYGSTARGDVESHSDIDLLLICNDCRKRDLLNAIEMRLDDCQLRLSMTIYTHKEFRFLASVQSLFLLHLRRESIRLFDRSGGFVQGILDEFHPKDSYRADFQKSLALLDSVVTSVEGSPNQLHRLSHIYALFRIFGVYLLAEKGIYEFSKEKMCRYLCELYPELAPSVQTLSILRSLNNLFFSRSQSQLELATTCELELDQCVEALSSISGRPIRVKTKSLATAIDEFVSAAAVAPSGMDYGSRVWFLLLVYDSLNLFCQKQGLRVLTGFDEDNLILLTATTFPSSVRAAATEVLAYMRNYPLKYFLTPKTKIRGTSAKQILINLAKDLEK